MAAKISTIVLKVDLDCKSCYKKISKTISQLQERENIETVVYDEKNNTVTISGPFDAKRLCKKLCCKACKVIKDIQIKDKEKPPPVVPPPVVPPPVVPPPVVPPPVVPPPVVPPPVVPPPVVPPPVVPPPVVPPPVVPPPVVPPPVVPPPVVPPPVVPPPVVPKDPPEQGCQPCWPGPVCVCGCKPWYGGYYGNNRCPWCGRGFDCEWVAPPLVVVQPSVVVYGAPPDYDGHKSCEFFYEEEPQAGCAIM